MTPSIRPCVMKRAPVAKFDLEEVKQLIENGCASILKERAIDKVIEAYANTSKPKSRDEAEEFIVSGLLGLEPKDFCERKWISDWGMRGQLMDVYGKQIVGKPWFIKFYIEYSEDKDTLEKSGWLFDVSFHAPDYDMNLADGITVINKGV